MRSVVILLALLVGLAGESFAQGQALDSSPSAAGSDTAEVSGIFELSLEDAIRSAIIRSDEARIARTEVDVAESQVGSARSAALPQIDANLGYTRTFRSMFDTGASVEIPDSLRFSPDPNLPLADRVRYLEEMAPLAGLGGMGALFGDLPFGQKNTYAATVSASQLLYSAGRVGAALGIAQKYRGAAGPQLSAGLSEAG